MSNKFDAGTKEVISSYLPSLFDVVHGECAEIPRKPDPLGLLQTIKELGTVPSRTIYVGDSPGDVVVSRNAGTYAVGVTWGYHHAENLYAASPDRLIVSPKELLDLIR